jgi:hypothetical protein
MSPRLIVAKNYLRLRVDGILNITTLRVFSHGFKTFSPLNRDLKATAGPRLIALTHQTS